MVSVAIQTFAGFFVALRCRTASPPVAKGLTVLMGPVFMGGVAIGFIGKLILLENEHLLGAIADRAFLPTWGTMLAVQCWHYLPLHIYLFWLCLQTVPENVEDFASAARMDVAERIRDIYWPHCRNMASFLVLYSTIQGLLEYSKFQLILRHRRGPGPNWPAIAWRVITAFSARSTRRWRLKRRSPTAPCSSSSGLCPRAHRGTDHEGPGGVDPVLAHSKRTAWFGSLVPPDALGLLVIVATLAPMVVLVRYMFHRAFIDPGQFVRSCLLALLALSLVMSLAIACGVSARLSMPRLLSSFGGRSLLFFLGLYLLLLVPPIGIALCGYYWLAVAGLGLRSPAFVVLLWLSGQTILAFPLLASFVQYNYFRVRGEEIDFQRVAGASFPEVAAVSFLERFKLDYALVALFGFAVIWNESTFNAVMSNFSRNHPSFAVELTRRVEGRASSYYEAVNLILVSLLPIVVGMALWTKLWDRERPRSRGRGG